MPRIAIDGYNLALRRGTGVATYARVLSNCLQAEGYSVDVLYGMPIDADLDPLLREVMFFDQIGGEAPRTKWWAMRRRDFVERFRAPFGYLATPIEMTGRVVSEAFQSRMPSFDRILNIYELFSRARRHFFRYRRFLSVRIPDPPALMHWTYPLPIRVQGAKNIYTVHDLVPLRLPYTTLDNKRYHFRLIKKILAESDHVVTVSEQSKRDLVALFGASPERITNTYESVSMPAALLAKSDQDLAAELRGMFNLELRGYFLFFGSIEPKKNIGRLTEAFLSANTRSPLVMIGAQAWKSKEELRFLDTEFERHLPDLHSRVRRLEYVPFPMLVSLIRGAKAVLLPSIYEGFGLPVLEAMLLGTPVLTSNVASLPEIAGDAALLVDPYDSASIAEGIKRLDRDDGLCRELAGRGLIQAQKFSVDRYRERLLPMYRRILAA